jgi:putative acetyltransferase
MNILIRNETASDIEAISQVTETAFLTLPISRHTEQFIIGALRAANALTFSLVAEAELRVVGHIAFSPVTISDGSPGWCGLGPVAVVPELHRRGIGSALVRRGLSELQALGAGGCMLVGDPGFYERFGFKNHPQLVHEGVPQEYFLCLPFGDTRPSGSVTFHSAFAATC